MISDKDSSIVGVEAGYDESSLIAKPEKKPRLQSLSVLGKKRIHVLSPQARVRTPLSGINVANLMSPKNADLELNRDCCICLNLMIEPVRLACGHRFCGTCLKQAANERPRCPLCRVKSPTAD